MKKIVGSIRRRLQVAAVVLILLTLGASPASADIVDIGGLGAYFVNLVLDIFKELLNGLLEVYKMVITMNPDPADFKPMSDDFVKMLVPVYALGIIVTGFYWLFLSLSPRGRARAKGMLLRLLLSMPFVLASNAIFLFILEIASLFTGFVFSLLKVDMGVFANIILECLKVAAASMLVPGLGPAIVALYLIIVLVLMVITLVVSLMRYMALFFLGSIFPLTIFMFSFDITKDIGNRLMRYTLMAAFLPVLQAFFIVFTVIAATGGANVAGADAVSQFAGVLARIGLVCAGIVLTIIAPLIMLNLMKWVGGFLVGWTYGNAGHLANNFGQAGNYMAAGITLTGGLLAGEGPGAVPLAMTPLFIGWLGPHDPAGGGALHQLGKRTQRWRDFEGRRGPYEASRGYETAPMTGERSTKAWEGKNPPSGRGGTGGSESIPSTPEEFMAEGEKLSATKQHDEAIDRFSRALSAQKPEGGYVLSNPERAKVYKRMGDEHLQLGSKNAKAAEECFRNAKRLDPEHKTVRSEDLAEGFAKVGDRFKEVKDLKGAVTNYEEAVHLDTKKPDYAIKLSDVLYEKG